MLTSTNVTDFMAPNCSFYFEFYLTHMYLIKIDIVIPYRKYGFFLTKVMQTPPPPFLFYYYFNYYDCSCTHRQYSTPGAPLNPPGRCRCPPPGARHTSCRLKGGCYRKPAQLILYLYRVSQKN